MPARSKKDLASDELEQALSHVGKALSLLGGRTRALSVRTNTRVFTVRKYLESVESRLRVCTDLLQLSGAPEGRSAMPSEPTTEEYKPDWMKRLESMPKPPEPTFKEKFDALLNEFPELGPRDEFEREYDATRDPGC
jgi:hypothetical protein